LKEKQYIITAYIQTLPCWSNFGCFVELEQQMEAENIDEFRTMLQHELITACTTIASNKLSSSLLCTVLDRKVEKEEEDDEEENKSHEVCDRILNKNFSRTCHSSEHPGRTMSRRQKTNKYSLTSSTAPTVAGGPATGFPKKQTRSLFQFNRMPRAGFVGLKNQGATCYLNSLLQSLFMIPEFRRGLFTLSDADFGMTLTTFPVEEISEENKSGNIIPYELQHLFIQLQTSDQKCISTKRVTDSFGWKDNQAMQQQDVSELNRILITALERCLRKTPAGNLIPSLYKGMLSYETTCSKCSYVSRREEEFYDIVLGLENVNSISQSLDLFMAPEALTGSNQYRCSMCGIKVDAERRTRITKLPPVMTFCLNRFKYDWSRGVRNKVNSLFEFPVELDFQPYFHVESKTEQGQLLAYDLASVIIHGGNANSGHYTAYIRDFIGEGSWKELFHKKGDNEEKSVKNNRSNSEAILPSFETNVPWDFDNPKNNSPVVSILRDLLLPPHKAEILLDDIGSVLSEVLKKSWKKNFKTQHGPIDAFVRGHSSVFRVKDNFVRLQPSAISPPSSTGKLIEEDIIKNVECNSFPIPEDAKSILAVNVPTPQSAQHEEGWFFFNDSNVTAISHNLLKSQFGDKGANGLINFSFV
jgi:ubiquitin C-terminal hydrolase